MLLYSIVVIFHCYFCYCLGFFFIFATVLRCYNKIAFNCLFCLDRQILHGFLIYTAVCGPYLPCELRSYCTIHMIHTKPIHD